MIAAQLDLIHDQLQWEDGHAREAREWMERHPEGMALFERFARQMAAKGHRFGVKLLAERVRWECVLNPDGAEDFKVNNNYTAYIARELCRRVPGLDMLIQKRRVRGG